LKKLICLIILLFITQLFSQNYGIKVGINSSEVIKNKTERIVTLLPIKYTKNRLGPNIGIFYNYSLSKYLCLNAELSYSQTGAMDEYSITGINQQGEYINGKEKYKSDYQIDNLQFALSLRPNYQINNISIYLSIGSTYTYPISKSNFYLANINFENTLGYLGGVGIKINKIFYYPILFEISRYQDINDFNKDEQLRSSFWSLKIGFYLK